MTVAKFEDWSGPFAVAGKSSSTRPRGGRVQKTLIPTRTDSAFSGPRVLVVNSYGGSLVQACKQGGYAVTGSYEHDGYGLNVQALNFPELEGLWASERAGWPTRNLEDQLVIAHPPCAPFSVQNNRSRANAGVDAKKFGATVDVLNYALGYRCQALLVESVPGALEGAREVHNHAAQRHRYTLYRVRLNACTFGVPQWRPRFWSVFIRHGLVRPDEPLLLVHHPELVTLGQVVRFGKDWYPEHQKKFDDQLRRLQAIKEDDLIAGRDFDLDGRLPNLLRDRGLDAQRVANEFVVGGRFESAALWLVAAQAVAPTLMANSWWFCKGQLCTRGDYNLAMGFPYDYRLPSSASDALGYLSRGVCPPIAEWLLHQVSRKFYPAVGAEAPLHGVWCEAGGIADLQPPVKTRKGLLEAVRAQR